MPITFLDYKEAKDYKDLMEKKGYVAKIDKIDDRQYHVLILGTGPTEIRMDKGEGSFYNSSANLINIDKETNEFQTHVALAHEISHKQLGHQRFITKENITKDKEQIINEENAWIKASEALKKTGEWNEQSKNEAIEALGTYYNGFTVRWLKPKNIIYGTDEYDRFLDKADIEANKKAARFIENL